MAGLLLVRSLGCVVTAAPGTGSTSLLSFFTAVAPVEQRPVADVVVDGIVTVDAKHATVAGLRAAGLLAPEEIAGLRIVTTTRNPFDFWAAEWHRTRTRWLAELRDPASWVHRQPGMLARIVDAVEQDFDPWLQRALGEKADQGATMHLNHGHVVEADVVVRMEHMDADVAGLLAGAERGDDASDEVVVPHVNITPGARPYWQLYGVVSRALVEQVHAPDLERFGYRF